MSQRRPPSRPSRMVASTSRRSMRCFCFGSVQRWPNIAPSEVRDRARLARAHESGSFVRVTRRTPTCSLEVGTITAIGHVALEVFQGAFRTRNGRDCSDRFPLITEAALRNRCSSFVLDGEAVLLGIDGRSDFNGLHSRWHNAEAQFLRLRCPGGRRRGSSQTAAVDAQPAWPGCWRAASTASSCLTSSRARSARIFTAKALWRQSSRR